MVYDMHDCFKEVTMVLYYILLIFSFFSAKDLKLMINYNAIGHSNKFHRFAFYLVGNCWPNIDLKLHTLNLLLKLLCKLNRILDVIFSVIITWYIIEYFIRRLISNRKRFVITELFGGYAMSKGAMILINDICWCKHMLLLREFH
jgi:hypothetical protein